MPVSVVQRAKRAFVAVLLALARQYGLVAPLAREDSDDAANALWRKVARKVHPDKGGVVAPNEIRHIVCRFDACLKPTYNFMSVCGMPQADMVVRRPSFRAPCKATTTTLSA